MEGRLHHKAIRRRLYSVKKPAVLKLIVFVVIFCLLWIYFYPPLRPHIFKFGRKEHEIHPQSFPSNPDLIHTSKCRIPNADPFSDDVKDYFQVLPYKACSSLPLLTYVELKDNVTTLKINETLRLSYSFTKIRCCYSNISRIRIGDDADNQIEISDCQYFKNNVTVTASAVMVKCRNMFHFNIYSNVHAVINPTQINDIDGRGNDNHSYSVLLVGIDSISKLNLIRTMPKTYNFLETAGFVNLKGYTKIDDNTFPNLMAILTGKTTEQIYASCSPGKNPMNGCGIIWDRFRDAGYVTAYAEDETSIGTFNYVRRGFEDQPTDFYFRPYFLAAEKLNWFNVFATSYCTGPESSGERILHLVQDFSTTLQDYSKFGLFWINTFSHNNLNMASSMDHKVNTFLRELSGDMTKTILIFFSDHGFRFGGIRHTTTGWLEERQPFIYMYLPESFQKTHANEYKNLMINSERLTNPFDLYMTLQHILSISSAKYQIESSLACPLCKSLFEPIEEDRTCEDAAIKSHWCICSGFSFISTKNYMVRETAKYLVHQLNKLIQSHSEGAKCVRYNLRKIVSAGIGGAQTNNSSQFQINNLLLTVETIPPALFEATVERRDTQLTKPEFRLLGQISRVNRYGDTSLCVQDADMRKYCYCDELLTPLKSAICNFLHCT